MKVIIAAALLVLPAATANAYPNWSAPEGQTTPVWQGYSHHKPWHWENNTPRRYIAHHRARHGHYGAVEHSHGNGSAVASLSSIFRPRAQCLINRLEAAGYKIDFMGGRAGRSGPSAHPTGNAIDINQTGFGRVTRRFPGNLEEMCHACGVYSGAHFGDYGHFEMPGKYGYVNIGRRYANHHWRHRRYARAY